MESENRESSASGTSGRLGGLPLWFSDYKTTTIPSKTATIVVAMSAERIVKRPVRRMPTLARAKMRARGRVDSFKSRPIEN